MNKAVRLTGAALLLCALTASRLACAADVSEPVPKAEPAATKPAPAVQPASKVEMPVLQRHWDALDPALLNKQVKKTQPRMLQPFPAEIHR